MLLGRTISRGTYASTEARAMRLPPPAAAVLRLIASVMVTQKWPKLGRAKATATNVMGSYIAAGGEFGRIILLCSV